MNSTACSSLRSRWLSPLLGFLIARLVGSTIVAVQAHERRQRDAALSCSTCGDAVAMFDELNAADGCLGRFQGSAVMPLIKAFITSSQPSQACAS